MLQTFFVKTDDFNASVAKDTGDESPHESNSDRLGCENGTNRVVLVFPVSFSDELVSSYP